MKALIYYGPKDIRLENIERPHAEGKDVVVKIMRAGICGSDLQAYLRDGHNVGILCKNEFPGIDGQFGHEMVGIVDEVGKDVTDVKVGDRVFVNPMVCKKDGMLHCDMSGAFSEYVLVENASYSYNMKKLSDSTSFDEAVMTEPLSVSTHAKNMINVQPWENVVIFGAGTIGLCALEACLSVGCKNPVVVDINGERLKLVEELGGTGFDSSKGDLKEFLCNHFGFIMTPFGTKTVDVDAYFDCAGAGNILNDIIDMTKPRARVAVVAVYKKPVPLNAAPLQSTEIRIQGILGYDDSDIVEAYNNIDQHRNHISRLVSHQFSIDDGVKAFETAADPSTGSVKVVINYEM